MMLKVLKRSELPRRTVLIIYYTYTTGFKGIKENVNTTSFTCQRNSIVTVGFFLLQKLLLLLLTSLALRFNFVKKYEITLFWPEYKAPFYRFVSDPVSDPDSNPDPNPDPKGLFRIRIRIRPKVSDPYGSGSGSGSV